MIINDDTDLYVRIRRVRGNERTVQNYTVLGKGGKNVNFLGSHKGWYKVPSELGEALREKRINKLNPSSAPIFDVYTLEEALRMEQQERERAQRAKAREEGGESPITRKVPDSKLRSETVKVLTEAGVRQTSNPSLGMRIGPTNSLLDGDGDDGDLGLHEADEGEDGELDAVSSYKPTSLDVEQVEADDVNDDGSVWDAPEKTSARPTSEPASEPRGEGLGKGGRRSSPRPAASKRLRKG